MGNDNGAPFAGLFLRGDKAVACNVKNHQKTFEEMPSVVADDEQAMHTIHCFQEPKLFRKPASSI